MWPNAQPDGKEELVIDPPKTDRDERPAWMSGETMENHFSDFVLKWDCLFDSFCIFGFWMILGNVLLTFFRR